MRTILKLIAVVGFVVAIHAEIIPPDRRITWQGNVGVKGGITNRTTIFTNLVILNTNAPAAAINAAIALCPNDQVVLLPNCELRLETAIGLKSYITLRGQGTNTIFRMNINGGNMVNFDHAPWRTTQTPLVSGYTKGSTAIVVGSTTDLDVGAVIQLTQLNAAYIFGGIEGDGGPYAEGQQVRIVGKTGSTLVIDPPLFADFNAGLSPMARWDVNGASGHWGENFCVYAGLEDMRLVNEHATASFIVYANDSAYCWAKNITTENAAIAHYNFYNTLGMEVRDGWMKNAIGPITSSRGYGVYLGTPNTGLPSAKSSSYLIENMIDQGTRGGPQIGYGSSGGVIGYCFFAYQTNEVATIQKADVFVHSSFPRDVLIEGCQGTKFNADNFHGNAGWITLARNEWTGRSGTKQANLGAIELDTKQRYYNAVGNVLGYPTMLSEISAMTSPAGTVVYSQDTPTPFNYDHHWAAYQLGYDGEGGGTSQSDTNVLFTLLRTGNVDYVAGPTAVVRWDPAIPDHSIPRSYYLSAQPSWWTVGKAWPPIGPDVDGYVVSIPARDRYFGTPVPPPPTNSPTPVTITGRVEFSGTITIYPK